MSLPGAHSQYEWHAFNVASIPVRFSTWYLVIVVLVMSRAGSFESGAVWLFAVTLSVLLHELGHGFAAKMYNMRPSILLHGFGGWCERQSGGDNDQELIISSAGPAVNLVLGGLFYFLVQSVSPASVPWWVYDFIFGSFYINLFGGVFNLLPVLPLDGGSIMLNLLSRRSRDAMRTTRQVSLGVGILAAVAGLLYFNSLFMLILFGILAWNNAAALGMVRSPRLMPDHNAEYRQAVGYGGAQPAYASRSAGLPGRSRFRPLPVSGGTAAALAAAFVIYALLPDDTAAELAAVLAMDVSAVTSGEVWRLFTWVLLTPSTRMGSILFAAGGIFLLGPNVERWLGPWKTAGLMLGGVVTTGIVAVVLGASFDDPMTGVLYGAAPLTVVVLGAWAPLVSTAWLQEMLPLPLNPWALLGVGVLVALWQPGSMLWVGVILFAAAFGLTVAGLLVPGRAPWKTALEAYKLRNPPEVDLDVIRLDEVRKKREEQRRQRGNNRDDDVWH